MIKDYLLRCQQELLERKIDLVSEIQSNEMSIRENEKLITLIKNSEDKSYTSLTPGNYKNDLDGKKIKELKMQLSGMQEYDANLRKKLDLIDDRISELEQIIHLEKDNSKVQYQKQKEHEESSQRYDTSIQQLKDILRRLDICSKMAEMDPIRCKIELKNLSAIVQKIIEDMQIHRYV